MKTDFYIFNLAILTLTLCVINLIGCLNVRKPLLSSLLILVANSRSEYLSCSLQHISG